MSLNSNDKRRMRLYYSDTHIPKEMLFDKAEQPPLYSTLSGAQRAETDEKTNAAVPSDEAVSEMRNWSKEKIM